MTDDEVALYQEQEHITQVLRRFSGPFPADNPPSFSTEELEYAHRLRERHQEIQRQLEQLQRDNSRL